LNKLPRTAAGGQSAWGHAFGIMAKGGLSRVSELGSDADELR
jgi:hypothetical protein